MTEFLSFQYVFKDSKNTILFLHGWGCNINYMLPLSYSSNYNSLVIDLPGFGKNKELSFPYTIDDFVEEIVLLISSLDIKVTHIVGHSFGGKLATRLSRLLKVKGLILISASTFHKIRGPKYYLKVWFYKFVKKFKIFSKLTNSFGSKDYKTLPPVMKKTMSKIINESVTTDLKAISIPTILIYGNKDKITPLYIAKRTKKLIKDCELIVLNGNHFVYLYNKQKVIRIIESLVSST